MVRIGVGNLLENLHPVLCPQGHTCSIRDNEAVSWPSSIRMLVGAIEPTLQGLDVDAMAACPSPRRWRHRTPPLPPPLSVE